jgi:hypothetical protein
MGGRVTGEKLQGQRRGNNRFIIIFSHILGRAKDYWILNFVW